MSKATDSILLALYQSRAAQEQPVVYSGYIAQSQTFVSAIPHADTWTVFAYRWRDGRWQSSVEIENRPAAEAIGEILYMACDDSKLEDLEY